ncbi:MAG: thiamine-phosphate kinase [Deferrisomatales bacterium]
MKIRELGEFGLLGSLGLFGRVHPAGWVGPGDDAAVLPAPTGALLFTTDQLVEDVHFRRRTTAARDLGYKCVAANASDIAAMGGRPLAYTVCLAAPGELSADWVTQLYEGLEEGAAAFRCPLVGGDTSAAPQVVLSIALLGVAAAHGPVLRSGARPGEDLFVSGSPGESAAGLRLLESGQPLGEPRREALVLRHVRPEPRLALGASLGEAGLASALIDVSDGLLQDLGHVLRASGVGAEIWAERLPVSVALAGVSRELGVDPERLVLAGGEDFELLFTAAPERRGDVLQVAREAATPVRRIGRVVREPGVNLTRRGTAVPLPRARGFDHFPIRPEGAEEVVAGP